MEKRWVIAKIPYDYDQININEAQERLNEAQTAWQELKEKGQEFYDKEILDYNKCEVGNKSEQQKAIHKKIIESIKK